MTSEGIATLYDKCDGVPHDRREQERTKLMATASVGIDVCKGHLDALILWADERKVYQQVSNNCDGHQSLSRWLEHETGGGVPVCLEATGRYGEAIARHLHQHNYPVSVVNPTPVKYFGAALRKRHKTDKSDAEVLARYQAQMQPELWQPPPLARSQLQDLKRLADDLQTDRTRVKNRLEGLREASPARPYLEEQLTHLEEQLKQVEAEMQTLLKQEAELQRQYQLLVTIKGIGHISALQLLAELPDLKQFNSADQLVAYAGLCPHQQQSGSRTGVSWLSKEGNGRIRKALYFPALSAKTHNPHLRRFAERLSATGKAKMVVVAAVMRKLLVLVYAILKSGRPYDPTYGFAA
jgi:transposase